VVAGIALVLASHLSGAGLSLTLPNGWHGRIQLDGGQAALEAHGRGISLRVDEVGNRPGTSGFVRVRRVVLRKQDLRRPQLAVRRLAVHGRSFVVTARLPAASSLGRVNDALSSLRISPPAGLSDAERKRLDRPVRLPSVRTGGRCPTSPRSRAAPGVATAVGRGPAYAVVSGALADDRLIGGLRAHKTLWAVSPRYRGPLLIRGHRLDGRGGLRFWPGRRRRMWWPGLWPKERRHWRYGPSTTLIPGSGCYGFQIDGTTFSRRIVFAVR
jgi:hypothetical protein